MLSRATLRAAQSALLDRESDLRYSVHLLCKIGTRSDVVDAALAETRSALEEIESVLFEVHNA